MNQTIISGNVVKKPELRATQSGVKIAAYSIACNRPGKDKETQVTDYYNVVAWGDLAEICATKLDKGTRVLVVGRFQTRNYEDKEGKKVYVTELWQNELWVAPTKVEKEDNGSIFDDSDLPF